MAEKPIPSLADLDDYEAQLDNLEKKIEQEEKEEETMYENLQKDIKEKLRTHMESGQQDISHKFESALNDQMHGLENRYSDEKTSAIKNHQTGILRLNKIIRDISRPLGDSWLPVYMYIMRPFPADEVANGRELIDKERPFMRGYKALTLWKDMSGDQINVLDLVEGLKTAGKTDLVEKCLDIMEAEGDVLMTINVPPKGPKTEGAAGIVRGGEAQANGASAYDGSGAASGDGAAPAQKIAPSTLEDIEGKRAAAERIRLGHKNAQAPQQGTLGDSRLLQISRKLGTAWLDLGKILEVPQEELDEIKASEDGYQAAFKMLWNWRDSLREQGKDGVDQLVGALNKMGKKDLAEIIQGATSTSKA